MLDGHLPVHTLTQKIIDNARRQVDETCEYLLPMAKNLGNQYERILSHELAVLER